MFSDNIQQESSTGMLAAVFLYGPNFALARRFFGKLKKLPSLFKRYSSMLSHFRLSPQYCIQSLVLRQLDHVEKKKVSRHAQENEGAEFRNLLKFDYVIRVRLVSSLEAQQIRLENE
jgi:hypothetical protein